MKRALVLAGGGVAGIAWELGVLRGLQDFDPGLAAQVIAADLVIGTSAGSAVAAQITSGTALDDLYQAQLSAESAEIEVELDMEELLARFTAATAGAASREEVQRNIGAMALDTKTVPEPARLAAVAARLPVPSWPDRAVLLPAIDAESGEMAVFTKDSGVSTDGAGGDGRAGGCYGCVRDVACGFLVGVMRWPRVVAAIVPSE